MIITQNGRSRSVRTVEEVEGQILKELSNLTPEEFAALEVLLADMNGQCEEAFQVGLPPGSIVEYLGSSEWVRPPVDIETFIRDPEFLGNTCDNLYPKLLEALKELFSGGYSEAILTGCVSLSSIIQLENGSLQHLGSLLGTSPRICTVQDSSVAMSSCNRVVFSGRKSCIQLTLANGMGVVLTRDHPVRVLRDGVFCWVDAAELREGELVQVAAKVPWIPDESMSEAEAQHIAADLVRQKGFRFLDIPDRLCRAPAHAIRAFIRELVFSAEGVGAIQFRSETVIRKLQLLFLRFGTRSHVYRVGDYWILSVELAGDSNHPVGVEKLIVVENVGPELVGDVSYVTEGHRFMANGVSVHNSIGFGKCGRGAERIWNLETGEYARIDELVGKTPLVPSLDADGKLVPMRAAKIWESGRKQCAKVTLASGVSFEGSLDHPLRTPLGYTTIQDLKVGDLVAQARKVPESCSYTDLPAHEIKVLAALIADGSTTQRAISYCKGDKILVEDFKENVGKLPPCTGYREVFLRGAWYVYPHGIQRWVESWGINCKSIEKRIPPRLFQLPVASTALLLNRLYTDGSVYTNQKPRRIELQLSSEGLIDDVQVLLRKVGVLARKYYSPKKCKGKQFPSWRLWVADADSILQFLDKVGPIFGKEEACQVLLEETLKIKSNTNWDVVPVTTSGLSEIRQETGPHKNADWNKVGNLAEGSRMGRKRFQTLCSTLRYTGRFAWYADADVVWERVQSVEGTGEHAVYDLTVPETHNAVVNGVVVHNTYLASIGACRILYELSCMRDPQKSFGLAPGSSIAITNMSVNETLARKVVFENISSKIKASPYFQKYMPFKATMREMRFAGSIWVAARAANDTSALGLNTISAIVDEANFMDKSVNNGQVFKDQAALVYNIIKRRMKSRFEKRGKLPGILFVISSKNTTDDFTQERVVESMDDPSVFVIDYALWDVRPPEFYSTEKFFVVAGNEKLTSRIVEAYEIDAVRETLPEDTIVVEVPEDFRHDFECDLEGSLRDLAGVATVAIHPFIQQRDKILAAFTKDRPHPCTTESYDVASPGTIRWDLLVQDRQEHDGRRYITRKRPIINPLTPRHVHFDPSLTGDAAGVAVVHISEWTQVVRRNKEGDKYTETAPIYYVDLVLQIIPPPGGEIILADLRTLVYDLTANGFIISGVTLDQFQSADTIQQLQGKGYNSYKQSVDITPEPYDTLKQALYENRVKGYHYPVLVRELQKIQEDRRGSRRKIDHPPKGSKDVADGLAGAVFGAARSAAELPLGILPNYTTLPLSTEEPVGTGLADVSEEAIILADVLPAFV